MHVMQQIAAAAIAEKQNRCYMRLIPVRHEGRCGQSSRNVSRDAMDAIGSFDVAMSMRTAKACGPGAPGLVPRLPTMIGKRR
jgi:hypothetical protein